MATRKKAETNGHVTTPVIEAETPPPEPLESLDTKLTYNCRTDTESLTIRTNSERELEELIARWKFRIIPKAKPKMNDGDKCQQCDGFMTTQTGHNRTTGKQYYYLACSNYPNCQFTAYLAPATQNVQAKAA